MVSLRKAMVVTAVVVFSAGSAAAYDVLIDAFDFASANNTRTISVDFITPMASGLDVGLPNVLGGSRQLDVNLGGAFLLDVGVITGDLLDYMSLGDGDATLGYSGGGAGLGSAIACASDVVVNYVNADAAAALGTDLTLALNDGVVTETNTQAVPAPGSGSVTFPLASFPTVDRTQLLRIGLAIDGSDSADLALVSIVATGCEAPEAPAPAMGAGPLALATLMLIGFGFVGFRRRFSQGL